MPHLYIAIHGSPTVMAVLNVLDDVYNADISLLEWKEILENHRPIYARVEAIAKEGV